MSENIIKITAVKWVICSHSQNVVILCDLVSSWRGGVSKRKGPVHLITRSHYNSSVAHPTPWLVSEAERSVTSLENTILFMWRCFEQEHWLFLQSCLSQIDFQNVVFTQMCQNISSLRHQADLSKRRKAVCSIATHIFFNVVLMTNVGFFLYIHEM